jgi:hypothetical protein
VQVGEFDVRRWPAPPRRRAVDYVVMHQRRGVQQLERREQHQHPRVRIVVGHRAPTPIGEGRAQPLAAGENELFQARDQVGVVAADVGGRIAALAQVSAQLFGDGVGELNSCRCFYAQRDTSFCVRRGDGPPSLFGAWLSSGFCRCRVCADGSATVASRAGVSAAYAVVGLGAGRLASGGGLVV